MNFRPRSFVLLLMLGAISVIFQQDSQAAPEEATKCVGGMTFSTNVEHPTPDCVCPLGQIFHMNIKGNTKNIGGCVNDPYYTQAGSGDVVQFVAGGQVGKVRYSFDGQTWTEGTGIDANHIPATFAFNGLPEPNSMWVMVARDHNFSNGADVRVYQSTDGIAWTWVTSIPYPPELGGSGIMCNNCHLQYGGENGRLVYVDAMYAVAETTFIWYSDDDGLTWTTTDTYLKEANTTQVKKITFNSDDNMFMTVGRSIPSIYRSFNGQSFGKIGETGIANVSDHWDIAYGYDGSGNGLFTIVGALSGSNQALIATSTDGGASWTQQTDPGTAPLYYFIVDHNGIAGAGSHWVAGGGVNDSRFIYSTDGTNWSKGTYDDGGYGCDAYRVATNGTYWVAMAGCDLPQTGGLLYSPDGINWSVADVFTENWQIYYSLGARRMINYNSKTHDNTWLMYTRNGTNGVLRYSTNAGQTWNTSSGINFTNDNLLCIRHNGQPAPNGKWYGLTRTASDLNKTFSSPDGITWTLEGSKSGMTYFNCNFDIGFNGDILVHQGINAIAENIWRSTDDGATYSSTYFDNEEARIVRYAANASKWLMIDGCEQTAYSTDGMNWTNEPANNKVDTLSCSISYSAHDLEFDGNRRWLALATTWSSAPSSSTGVYYSDDQGKTWDYMPEANKPAGQDAGFGDVAHNGYYGSSGKWIGIGVTDPSILYSSPDGITWTLAYDATGWEFIHIVHNGVPGSGLWMALARNTGFTQTALFKSTDGITWTGPHAQYSNTYSMPLLEYSRPMR